MRMFGPKKSSIRWRTQSRQAGLGLIEMIVALGASACVAFVWAQQLKKVGQEMHALDAVAELESIRRGFIAEASCSETLADTACAESTPQPISLLQRLKDGSTRIILAEAGQRIGRFDVKAECYMDGERKLKISATWVGAQFSSRSNEHQLTFGSIDNRTIDIGCSTAPSKAVTMCHRLGGSWDPEFKCLLPNGLIYSGPDDATPSIDRSTIISCDLKAKGTGGDLRTCDRTPAGVWKKGYCYISGNSYFFKTGPGAGAYKKCEGGVYINP